MTSQRGLTTALVTANVFHNALSRCDPFQTHYFTELLRQLPSQPVKWYMTALDFDLAFTLWDIYGLGGSEACLEAYAAMRERVIICQINTVILEETGYHQRPNFYDSIRLACAVDRNVDVIVTWEPHQFARTLEEHYRIHVDGYFHLNIATEPADPDDPAEHSLGIFSVGAFLLNLDRLHHPCFPRERCFRGFQLEDVQIDSHGSSDNVATVILRYRNAEQIQQTARGLTPIDALLKAMDQVVDCYVTLPERRLGRFFVPATTLYGADAPVEVVLGIDCGGCNFEESASNNNLLWAAADAYMKVINSICRRLLDGF